MQRSKFLSLNLDYILFFTIQKKFYLHTQNKMVIVFRKTGFKDISNKNTGFLIKINKYKFKGQKFPPHPTY